MSTLIEKLISGNYNQEKVADIVLTIMVIISIIAFTYITLFQK
jgi:hypothetical protein